MIEFIAKEVGEDGSQLRDFYAAIFDGAPLPAFPWGDAKFDCILVSSREPSREVAISISKEIVRHRVDWVQCTGPHAELLHDLVDDAAVGVGRQAKVGDGSPMTSWHEDAVSLAEIADVARLCLGGADFVLCLIMGDHNDLKTFAVYLVQSLADSSAQRTGMSPITATD